MKLPLLLALFPFVLTLSASDAVGPPPFKRYALSARYALHWTDYVTISVQDDIKGYPSANLKPVSDGPANNGSGNIYLHMSDMEISQQDQKKDNRCTISASLAEVGYCEEKEYSPLYAVCVKIVWNGRLVRVDNTSSEYNFAKSGLMEKHPAMKKGPTNRDFSVFKLDIEQIEVLDFFGGVYKVSNEDYFSQGPVNDVAPPRKSICGRPPYGSVPDQRHFSR